MTHICVAYLTIIVSDNGLSPSRCQAIILTNSGILLIRPLGTNFSEILIEIDKFSFMKMDLKVSSAKWRPFCVGLYVLRWYWITIVLYVYRRPGRDVSHGVILWNNVFYLSGCFWFWSKYFCSPLNALCVIPNNQFCWCHRGDDSILCLVQCIIWYQSEVWLCYGNFTGWVDILLCLLPPQNATQDAEVWNHNLCVTRGP